MQFAREPGGVSGGSLPELWGRVDGAPKPSARTENLLRFVFLFRFYRRKGQRMKKKWRKIDEKTRFGGTLGFFLL